MLFVFAFLTIRCIIVQSWNVDTVTAAEYLNQGPFSFDRIDLTASCFEKLVAGSRIQYPNRVHSLIRGGGPQNGSLDHDLSTQHYHGQKSYLVSIYSVQNKRSHMEDEYFSNNQGNFVSIMDGHGGRAVSRYIRQNLYARYLQMLSLEQIRFEAFVKQHHEAASTQLHEVASMNHIYPNKALLRQEQLLRNSSFSNDESSKFTIQSLSAKPRIQMDNNWVRLTSMTPCIIPHSIETHIKALRAAFETIDSEILRVSHWSYQGSTAIAVLLQDFDENESRITSMDDASLSSTSNTALIAANVGDSRAVLCRAGIAVNLSIDHKPDLPLERVRIEKMGGRVQLCKIGHSNEPSLEGNSLTERNVNAGSHYHLNSHFKSPAGVYRINGNLALSRAFGDRSERPLISSEADISYTVLNPLMDEFVILASDGLWDVFDSSQDVVEFIIGILIESELAYSASRNVPEDESCYKSTRCRMAQRVVDEAIKRGSMDNISVAIIWLRP